LDNSGPKTFKFSRIHVGKLLPAPPQLLAAPHQFFIIPQLPLLEYTKGKLGFLWISENGEAWWWVTAEELKRRQH